MLLPLNVAQAAPAENYHLNGWNEKSGSWTTGNLSGYTELDWVPFRLQISSYAGVATEICYQHDYEKLGTYGFSSSRNFYIADANGNELFSLSSGVFSVSGPTYRTENSGVMIVEYCFNILNKQA